MAEVIRFEAARAWGWYDRGLALLDVLDRRSAACCAAMAGIYLELLNRIAADPTPGHARAAVVVDARQAARRRALADPRTGCMNRPDAIVVGGGLAGITAALKLADAGRAVVLLEGRPRLGGAAFSFRRGDLSVDNGQHVFLRCCDAYRWLLERLDVVDQVVLQPHLDIPVLRADGRRARLRRMPGVPAPAHLTGALATYGLLSPADRLRAVRGALALRRLDPADPELDARTLGEFLRAHGQNDATIGALWGIVATATLNLSPDEASLALAAKVFRTGLLDHAERRPTSGTQRRRSARCTRPRRCAPSRTPVWRSRLGQRVDSVVRPARCAPTNAAGRRTQSCSPCRTRTRSRSRRTSPTPRQRAPATSARRPSSTCTSSTTVRSPTCRSPLPSTPRCSGSSTAPSPPACTTPRRTVSTSPSRCRPRTARSTCRAARCRSSTSRNSPGCCRLPGSATVLDSFVTRERRATFRQAAGSAALRPGADVGVPGLWLAGAWTATGWPDTMESAVRSGISAAEGVLGEVSPTASTVGTVASTVRSSGKAGA